MDKNVKGLLKPTYVVTLRDNTRLIYLCNGNFIDMQNGNSIRSIDSYDDNLLHSNKYCKYREFDIMKIEFGDEVIWERGEEKVIKLTKEQRLELEYMKAIGAKYVAKDYPDKVYVYEKKPTKDEEKGYWVYDEDNDLFYIGELPNKLRLSDYDFISFNDKEPMLIDDILEADENNKEDNKSIIVRTPEEIAGLIIDIQDDAFDAGAIGEDDELLFPDKEDKYIKWLEGEIEIERFVTR